VEKLVYLLWGSGTPEDGDNLRRTLLERTARQLIDAHRRWPEVRDLVLAGTLTRAERARRLKVRRADFIAALDAFRNGGPAGDLVAEVGEPA